MKCDVLKENIELNDNKNTYYDNVLEWFDNIHVDWCTEKC